MWRGEDMTVALAVVFWAESVRKSGKRCYSDRLCSIERIKQKKQRILLKKWRKNGCALKKNMIYYKSDFWRTGYFRSEKTRPCGQAVKTAPSHGAIPGSIPGKVTKQVKSEPVSGRRRIRLYHILQKDLLNEKRRARVYLTRRFSFYSAEIKNTP